MRGPLQTNYWRLTADVEGFMRQIRVAYNPQLEHRNFVDYVQDQVAPLGIYIDSIVVPSTRMGSCFNYKVKDQNQYKAAAAMSSIQMTSITPIAVLLVPLFLMKSAWRKPRESRTAATLPTVVILLMVTCKSHL